MLSLKEPQKSEASAAFFLHTSVTGDAPFVEYDPSSGNMYQTVTAPSDPYKSPNGVTTFQVWEGIRFKINNTGNIEMVTNGTLRPVNIKDPKSYRPVNLGPIVEEYRQEWIRYLESSPKTQQALRKLGNYVAKEKDFSAKEGILSSETLSAEEPNQKILDQKELKNKINPIVLAMAESIKISKPKVSYNFKPIDGMEGFYDPDSGSLKLFFNHKKPIEKARAYGRMMVEATAHETIGHGDETKQVKKYKAAKTKKPESKPLKNSLHPNHILNLVDNSETYNDLSDSIGLYGNSKGQDLYNNQPNEKVAYLIGEAIAEASMPYMFPNGVPQSFNLQLTSKENALKKEESDLQAVGVNE